MIEQSMSGEGGNIAIPSIETGHLQPLVVVRCMTYNHERYIRDTLEGFVNQQTNFQFIVLVHDDASIDSTPTIIREYVSKYPNIIVPIFEKENQYSKGDGSHTKIIDALCQKSTAKYIAFCEGDDYWIDPLKLQKQVDFLEKNLDYSACVTKFICYDEYRHTKYAIVNQECIDSRAMLWDDFQFGTATLFTYAQLYYNYYKDIRPCEKDWLMGDKPLMLYLGYHGKVKTLNDTTAVYRILEKSASHSKDLSLQLKRARNTVDIFQYFAQLYYPKDIELKGRIEGGYLYRAFTIYRKHNMPLSNQLKVSILSYSGSYPKLKIVKRLLYVPFLIPVAYQIAKIKNKLKLFFQS